MRLLPAKYGPAQRLSQAVTWRNILPHAFTATAQNTPACTVQHAGMPISRDFYNWHARCSGSGNETTRTFQRGKPGET
jgi:hypothetical protein